MWERLVATLKRECPTRRCRVVVRRVEMKEHGGTVESDKGGVITVTIRKQDTLITQMDSLTHEWGHVLDYDRWKEHGRRWGRFHAGAYQVLEKIREEGK